MPLTSLSILFARYKGDLREFFNGIKVLELLNPGDKVLIAEACMINRAAVLDRLEIEKEADTL